MARLTLALIVGVIALGGCQTRALHVDDAQVRLAPVAGGIAAAYFTVHGGAHEDRLIDVSSPRAIRAELHESMTSGGMGMMKPLTAGVAIPADETVAFAPGGRHVMLFDVDPLLVPPNTMPLTLNFASGARITVNATLRRAGDL